MYTLILILVATLGMSVISLIGAVTFIFRENILRIITIPLVAFSAGAMLGGALLHLIPEAIENSGHIIPVMVWVIFGFLVFFILEQFISWHHCHRMPSEHTHPVTVLILISDALHNFLDGLTIGAAFLINPGLGFVTTLAVAAHEIPQELGDFGILVHGGWKKGKALLFNFVSGLTAVLGGMLVWIFSAEINLIYLVPFAAGNFIYIAAADLIPEFKGCDDTKKNIINFSVFLLGLLLMYGLLFLHF